MDVLKHIFWTKCSFEQILSGKQDIGWETVRMVKGPLDSRKIVSPYICQK